jgi:hypothetical protein
MLRRFVLGVFCTSVLAVPPAQADEEGYALDRIEVTGSRISYRDLLDVPAVAITKRGDYLSQGFTLINDTRSAEGRGEEIHATIRKLIARAGSRYAVVHDDGYAQTLTTESPPVATVDDPKRPDTSRVTLRVRVDIDSDDPAQIERLRSFLRGTAMVGRTELELDPETALGMRRPERYRYELLDAIAADSQRLRTTMGSGCEVTLDGLNSRIEWERVGPLELLLYVPYSMTVAGCGAVGTP